MQGPRTETAPIEVTVIEKVIYTFPNPEAKCSAHGQTLCVKCARNGPCTKCDFYADTGMHWDTCANRIR